MAAEGTREISELTAFFADAPRWGPELARLRALLLDCGLEEAFKWRQPCYGVDGGNVAILQSMKDHLSLMFFKGALLEDPVGLLEPPGPNSRAARRLLFRSIEDVELRADAVRAFVGAAVALERAGATVEASEPIELVAELKARFARDPELEAAFFALTPGRQRAYHLHFSSARRPETRERRIEKVVGRIREGRGLRD